MKVSELILELAKYNPDAEVCILGSDIPLAGFLSEEDPAIHNRCYAEMEHSGCEKIYQAARRKLVLRLDAQPPRDLDLKSKLEQWYGWEITEVPRKD